MANELKRALAILDPLTGLPRPILNQETPEVLVDEHFVYKTSVMDYSDELVIGDTKYMIDIDEDFEDEY
jgi:hypothetical protein